MIHSRSSRLMIHGLGQQAAAVYKVPDGTVKEGCWAVADGSGGAAEPVYVLGCYDAPYGVAYATAALAATADYDLSGMAVPAGSVVYLSRAGADAAPEDLEAGVFASVQSDDEGAWSYAGVEGFDGMLWAWVKVPATVLDTLDAGISCSMETRIRRDAEDANIQHVSIPAVRGDDPNVVANSWSYVDYTFTGTAPGGVEAVYVSADSGDLSTLTVDALTQRVKATVVPGADGAYTATLQDYGFGVVRFIVWCLSETGTLTASMTWTGGTCLSGDTLITLADGGTRRLAEVRPGDLLLAGDGTATRVRRVARGCWNDHHTLYRFEDGTVIDEIHAHRFYNCEAGFWQLLGNL